MCLDVDKAAMDSMASNQPWVFALDMSFDPASRVKDGEYPGYFRVAIDAIIPELYSMLAAMTPRELWPPENTIWVSAFY